MRRPMRCSQLSSSELFTTWDEVLLKIPTIYLLAPGRASTKHTARLDQPPGTEQLSVP